MSQIVSKLGRNAPFAQIKEAVPTKRVFHAIPPSQTLYVNNLNDKIPKQQLRRSLYHIFSQYGSVLDVVALKTEKLRGQAWIVFDSVEDATNAMRQLQKFPFYDKELRVNYAKGKSDAVAKLDGTWIPKHKRKRGVKGAALPPAKKPELLTDGDTMDVDGAAAGKEVTDIDGEEEEEEEEEETEPNHILIATKLPPTCTEPMLRMLFQQFSGLDEIRLIAGKKMAFIEYGNADQATVARSALKGFKLSVTDTLKLDFAKK